MSDRKFTKPGVYIEELDAMPADIVPAATAVSAFIGYTPRAEIAGESCLNKAVKIGSLAEFMDIYMFSDPGSSAADPANECPQYYLSQPGAKPTSGASIQIDGTWYQLSPDADTIYYLYNSVRLFYYNGGGDAYIVSVGDYGPASGKPMADPAAPVVNSNVRLKQLMAGLGALQAEVEPTVYVCPDATLLNVADNARLMRAMLRQAAQMGTAVCLFDVIGGRAPDPVNYTGDIETFRNSTGSDSLDRGVCYYPFVCSSVVEWSEVDFLNLFGGDTAQLHALIDSAAQLDVTVSGLLQNMDAGGGSGFDRAGLHRALLGTCQVYKQLMQLVLEDVNMLPPSGAMAGIYAMTDMAEGVWKAPANVAPVAVSDLPLRITDDAQAVLNIDPVSGKSVNALRVFPGRGVLVWGARTLDGNSQDWRYVNIRRTAIWLEQSIGQALGRWSTEPNTPATWSMVEAMVSSFLQSVWQNGGLMGASASDAFGVQVGLGKSMTAEDVRQGILRLEVFVCLMHPAEFMVLSFEQKVSES